MISQDFIDRRVKELEAKVADYLSSHLEADLHDFLRYELVLFTFRESRSALHAVLTAEGGDPAALRLVKRIFVELEKRVDQFVLGELRKVPRGAPTGERKSTREKKDRVRGLYDLMKELARREGKRMGKSKVLPEIARLEGLSEDAVDALIWPRQRKKKQRE